MKHDYINAIFLLSLVGILTSSKNEIPCEGRKGNIKPPIVAIGSDQVITFLTDSISLDGNASSDQNGKANTWPWAKIAGMASFGIINPSVAKTVVKNPVTRTYQFKLKVTDHGSLSATDNVQIIVDSDLTTNDAPISNAGADQTITFPANTANLDGSGSTDLDNNIAGYTWTKVSGPSPYNIANSNAIQTQVANLVQGTYVFELKVVDVFGLVSKDTVKLDVNQPLQTSCNSGTRPLVVANLVPIGTLSKSRPQIAIASVGNKIFFAGGLLTSRVDIYDVLTNSWTTRELSEARNGIGTAVHGDKVFFAGGTPDGYNNYESSRVDIYSETSGTWSTAELSQVRSYVSGISIGKKVIFAGGMVGFDQTTPVIDVVNADTNAWSSKTLSQHRAVDAATVINGKAYFTGGVIWTYTENNPSSRIDIYNLANDSWTFSEMSMKRIGLAGVAVGNKNYWAGGISETWGLTAHVEVRDAITNTSTFECLFQPNAYFKAVLKGNKIIFFTGEGAVKDKFDIYDTSTHTWSIGVLPATIYQASIISVNDVIYVAGGYVNGVLSNQVWKLEFNTTLPIKPLITSTEVVQKDIILKWRTAQPKNTVRFIVERSVDGINFLAIGAVTTRGNSVGASNYSFTDKKTFSATNFYRIKGIDDDSTATYSKVTAVKMIGTNALQIFPNPAKDILHVQVNGISETPTLQITDVTGRKLKEETVIINGSNSFSVDIKDLPRGVYFLSLKNSSGIQQQKFLKQ